LRIIYTYAFPYFIIFLFLLFLIIYCIIFCEYSEPTLIPISIIITEYAIPSIMNTDPIAATKFITLALVFIAVIIYLTLKIGSRIHVNSDGLVYSFLFRPWRRYHWQDIISVKSYSTLGLRCLDINNRSLLVSWGVFNLPRMLDRVQHYAGEDHPLTRALSKEVSRPFGWVKKICWVVGMLTLILSIWIVGGNIAATEQEKPLNNEIAAYIKANPKVPPNHAAIEFQTLITKLGLSMEHFGDGSEVKIKPDKSTIAEVKEIEPILSKYLDDQLNSIEDSRQPMPDKLASYVSKHQTDIAAIKKYTASNQDLNWGLGSYSVWLAKDKLNDSNTFYPKYLNHRSLGHVENLLILDILDHHNTKESDILENLLGIKALQKSLLSQTHFVSSLVFGIQENKIARLARKIERIPDEWSNSWSNKSILATPNKAHHNMTLAAIKTESYFHHKLTQNLPEIARSIKGSEIPYNWLARQETLIQPYLRLVAVYHHKKVNEELLLWEKANICRINGTPRSPLLPFPLNNTGFYLNDFVSTYRYVLFNDLRWELTSGVRQIKSELAKNKQAIQVAKDFELASNTCPGEKWTAQAQDNTITISFSNSQKRSLLESNKSIVPTTYKIKAKA
jgi:hypothetical protein